MKLDLAFRLLGEQLSIIENAKSSTSEMFSGGSDGHATRRIGDSGAWPGNDFEVSHELGLCVGGVSTGLTLCWNLLPPGTRSVDGTMRCLRRLMPHGTGLSSFDGLA
jgi:hypothetical protein